MFIIDDNKKLFTQLSVPQIGPRGGGTDNMYTYKIQDKNHSGTQLRKKSPYLPPQKSPPKLPTPPVLSYPPPKRKTHQTVPKNQNPAQDTFQQRVKLITKARKDRYKIERADDEAVYITGGWMHGDMDCG